MDDPGETYTQAYYDAFKDTSLASARIVVPIVMRWLAPASVIDLGCGLGAWLSAFREAGVEDLRGVDGSYVEVSQLLIDRQVFVTHDLASPYAAERRFDLAMSVEVAEHLPPESAPRLVDSLTALAPAVLFSASIPHQHGERHVNCQWPAYWADLFARRGYVVIDALRPALWEDARVDWWYRQNLMIYADEARIAQWPELARLRQAAPSSPLPLVHPEMFKVFLDWGLSEQSAKWELYKEIERLRGAAPEE